MGNSTKYFLPALFLCLVTSLNLSAQSSGTYTLNKTTSLMVWYCQEEQQPPVVHSGSFMFAEGTFTVSLGNITSGSFELDMKSMVDNDLKDKAENAKLLSRLSAPNFFNIQDHPRARFQIAQVTAGKGNEYVLEGTLTLRGVTRPFRIPATIKVNDKDLEIISDTALIEGVQFGLKAGEQTAGLPEIKNFKMRISQLFAKKAAK